MEETREIRSYSLHAAAEKPRPRDGRRPAQVGRCHKGTATSGSAGVTQDVTPSGESCGPSVTPTQSLRL